MTKVIGHLRRMLGSKVITSELLPIRKEIKSKAFILPFLMNYTLDNQVVDRGKYLFI